EDIFAKTYIINLPERLDRKRGIERELKGIGSGLTPGKIELFPGVKPEDTKGFPTKGVLGCYLSHLEILKEARDQNLENVLVIEDDLAISKRFNRIAKQLSSRLESLEWGIVFLGFFPYKGLKLVDYYQSSSGQAESSKISLISSNYPTQGTHFYAVNHKAYDRVIEFLEDLLEQRSNNPDLREKLDLGEFDPAYIDTAYFLFKVKNPDINIFNVSPNLGWQRDTRSDVTLSKVDNLSRFSCVIAAYRAAKSEAKKYLEFVSPSLFSR
ncbi:MAG: glycosyltransferase family 25 protein, partial [Leptolyngbyaceae cyanobacterium SM2_5_2]|nr:glycosyltransferase family 25 protein [Leptolyngbyaceae cyanobacterium SM2_5_2]